MRHRNGKTRALALLSTILFSWYWCSVTLFFHSHLIDGERILHSHPYTGTAPTHGHSAGALHTISYLSLLTALTVALASALAVASNGRFMFAVAVPARSQAPVLRPYSLRAPPVS